MPKSARLLSALLFAACAPTAFAAPSYSMTLLSTDLGYTYTPYALNNNGIVAGVYNAPEGQRGFSWQAGQITALPDMSFARGVGAQGQIVGASLFAVENGVEVVRGVVRHQGVTTTLPDAVASPDFHYTQARAISSAGVVAATTENSYGATSFLWHNGSTTLLPIDYAEAINAGGNVAGYSSPDEGQPRAQLVIGGQLVELGLLPTDLGPGTASYAFDLNDAGTAVGSSSYGFGSASRQQSFIFQNGAMEALGSFGGANSAEAINNQGAVVGNFSSGDNTMANAHAYLYQDGTQYDLDLLLVGAAGWRVFRAVDINDNGDIAAMVCQTGTSSCTGALLSPVPEPATYGMLLAGLGLVGWARNRQLAAWALTAAAAAV